MPRDFFGTLSFDDLTERHNLRSCRSISSKTVIIFLTNILQKFLPTQFWKHNTFMIYIKFSKLRKFLGKFRMLLSIFKWNITNLQIWKLTDEDLKIKTKCLFREIWNDTFTKYVLSGFFGKAFLSIFKYWSYVGNSLFGGVE